MTAAAPDQRHILSAVPTPGEKKALLFLSLVAVLGAGARLVSANGVPVPTAAERHALEEQIRAVDAVRRGLGVEGGGRRKGRRSRAKRSADTTNPATPPFSPPPVSTLRLPPPALDIDRASVAQLESLPGIGPALARRIAASR
ncbi:MAG: helix-hairpin-helix domain-containing protein, partial [Gemmatimonadota bacterium]|nr:helix-hairpin-helix domain-containing protein [Gemmatimonadota bacterium]